MWCFSQTEDLIALLLVTGNLDLAVHQQLVICESSCPQLKQTWQVYYSLNCNHVLLPQDNNRDELDSSLGFQASVVKNETYFLSTLV